MAHSNHCHFTSQNHCLRIQFSIDQEELEVVAAAYAYNFSEDEFPCLHTHYHFGYTTKNTTNHLKIVIIIVMSPYYSLHSNIVYPSSGQQNSI